MKKVLIILGTLGNEGISNSVLSYLENFPFDEDLQIVLGVAGSVTDASMKRVMQLPIRFIQLPYRKKHPLKYFFKIKSICKNEKIDIFHVHGNSTTLAIDLLAAKLGGVRIRIAHSRNTSCTHKGLNKLFRPLFNATVTDGFACGIEAGKWLFLKKSFTVMPNGKKINKYVYSSENREKYRNELNLNDSTIALGHVGIFNKQKNHKFLIEVFDKLLKESKKDYKLFLFGVDDGEYENIYNLVNKWGLEKNIIFMGFKNNIYDYLSAMDIMLFPSLYEGFPNVVLEWQINGLPAIISDRITDECVLSDLVKKESIDDSKLWVEDIANIQIVNRETLIEKSINTVNKAGYNIELNAKFLKSKYLELIEKK